jgi:hypothetical protein
MREAQPVAGRIVRTLGNSDVDGARAEGKDLVAPTSFPPSIVDSRCVSVHPISTLRSGPRERRKPLTTIAHSHALWFVGPVGLPARHARYCPVANCLHACMYPVHPGQVVWHET